MAAFSACRVQAQASMQGPLYAGRPKAQRPLPPQALSFRVQHSSLASSTSSGGVFEAPYCPWPQDQPNQASQRPQGVLASIFAATAESSPEGSLPPEMDRVMRFTDGPGAQEESNLPLLLRLWRYQGP